MYFAPRPFNPLNGELNPICNLLALFGAHHILHISRIRVNVLNQEQNSVVLNAYIPIHIKVTAMVLILQTWEISLTFSYIETFVTGQGP